MKYPLSSDIQRVKFAREAGAVRRLHVHRIIGEYDIAQHTFGALCLLRVLNPLASPNLFWAVLSHDKPERLTGDIPAPAKWHGAWFDKSEYSNHEDEILNDTGFMWGPLTWEEELWLRSVDSLEFFLFCLDQESLGNKTVIKPKGAIQSYIEHELDTWPWQIKQFYEAVLSTSWEMCNELGQE